MRERTLWEQIGEQNPDRSRWYVERFRSMAAAGEDLAGEARFVHAMLAPGARVLDGGCGPGRVGGALAAWGHTVVGVDVDPVLVAAARADHPGSTWLEGDLAELDLPARGVDEPFDVAVLAGNVITFVAPGTHARVLARVADHLRPDGRVVVGFGAGRGYAFEAFESDAAAAGLRVDLRLATWDLRPAGPDDRFRVSVLSRA